VRSESSPRPSRSDVDSVKAELGMAQLVERGAVRASDELRRRMAQSCCVFGDTAIRFDTPREIALSRDVEDR
jgi:hypothetical protein